MSDSTTHSAYSDESYYTASQYRSIAVVTLETPNARHASQRLARLLRDSQVREFKWQKLRQARYRFAALKMVDLTVELALADQLRADVLVWDTYDSRHKVQGRDDLANLQRMYYHLFKNILQKRWPADSTWQLHPDENSALDWKTVQDYLDTAGLNVQIEGDLFSGGERFELRVSRDFRILEISEACSADTPLCQLADLFAGLGVFSYASYGKFEGWSAAQSAQMMFALGSSQPEQKLSNSDQERCLVMAHLDNCCKKQRLGVGLTSSRGFKTYDPSNPINFWIYEPQHPDDKAPVRESS